MKKVLFFVNERRDEGLNFSREVLAFLLEKGCEVFTDDDYGFASVNRFKAETTIDFALILGGDGTVLSYLHRFGAFDFPFFGINLGHVGSLVEGEPGNYKEKLMKIFRGEYVCEERNVISCSKSNIGEEKGNIAQDNCFCTETAFNEVSLHRGRLFKTLSVNLFLNGTHKTTFFADGVIIATTTGSGAYNLSAGGPLLFPTAANFVITPICPQLPSIASLVISDNDRITITIDDQKEHQITDENKPEVVIDGRLSFAFDTGSVLTITRAVKKIKIIRVDRDVPLWTLPGRKR